LPILEGSLEWGSPLALQQATGNAIYSLDLDSIPAGPGVYVFFRKHGHSVKALYVGKAGVLRNRITQQLEKVSLMKGIENADTGAKYLVCGLFKPKRGQSNRSLGLIERGLIRYRLAQGDKLINIHGTHILKHSVTSDRTDSLIRRMIRPKMFFED
jgi:hypothetical protein